MGIRILLADDHKIMRDGLRTLLEKESDMEVVGEAETGRMAVRLTRQLLPEVVILDVTMSDLNGIEAACQITEEFHGVKVVALSMHSDRRYVAGMLKAGASAYLLKACAFEELAQAIRLVMANKTYLSPGITDIVIDGYLHHSQSTEEDYPVMSVLTARERQVLQLLAEGQSSKRIADTLCLSVKTIESHRLRIMDKLKIHSIAELTKFAVREGLTSLDP